MKYIYNDPKQKDRRRELRNVQTDSEKLLWTRLRNRRFYSLKFYRQYSVGGYILDFYSPELKLNIELDGYQHKERKVYDQLRTEFLKTKGIKVVRFWNSEVLRNTPEVLKKIERYITPSQSPS